MSEEIKEIKLLIMGSCYAGKGALMWRYVFGEFLEEPNTALWEPYSPEVTVNDGNKVFINVDYVDFDSEHLYYSFCARRNDGFILCFALDDLSTFQALPDVFKFLLRVKDTEKPPIILVGTKSDIEESKRKVPKEQAEEYASQISCEYFEVSSLTTSNVKEAYQCIIQKTYDYLKSKLLEKEEKKKGKEKRK